MEQTEFEFPEPGAAEENPRKGGAVVDPENAAPEIEVVDDTPEADRGRKPMAEPPKDVTEDELAKYDESVQKRIKHFSKGFHEERRAKETAQREKDEALRLAQAVVEENKRLKGSLSEGQQALLTQAKKTVEIELGDAKRKYKAAYEAGDPDALIAAQEEITRASIKAERVNNFRVPPLQPERNDVQPEREGRQREYVPTTQVDPNQKVWQDSNTWFGPNRRMTAYALGLHEDLVEEGVPVGSEAYYKRIDADMRERFSDMFESENAADAKTQQRKSNVVAPATRGTAPKKVVLTKTQVDIAKRLGVPLELYARKVAEQMRG
jgi:hypothetical protein